MMLDFQIEYLLFLQNFREETNHIFDWLFCHITMFGEYCIAMMLIAFVYWIVDKKCGIYMIWNFFAGVLVNQFIKITACIYRPWILDSRIHPIESAMKMATGYSFPSGHTAIAAGTLGALAIGLKNSILKFFLALLILLVAFSRNYLGVHTLQDVIVSLILGGILLFFTAKILKWIENGKNRDLIVYGIIMFLCLILIIYTKLKSYPIDYLSGVILVDPAKMRFESFPKAGFCSGAFTGWLIERRFINFDPKAGSIGFKIIIYLFGAVLLYILLEKSTPCFITLMNEPCGRFSSCFLIGIFITGIYPAFIKLFEKYNNKKADKA